jgi:hypothetical protein
MLTENGGLSIGIFHFLYCSLNLSKFQIKLLNQLNVLYEFYEGNIIIVNPALKPEHNDFPVVFNEEDEATFKQLKKYGETRVLHPLNPKFEDIELNRATEYRVTGIVSSTRKSSGKSVF